MKKCITSSNGDYERFINEEYQWMQKQNLEQFKGNGPQLSNKRSSAAKCTQMTVVKNVKKEEPRDPFLIKVPTEDFLLLW